MLVDDGVMVGFPFSNGWADVGVKKIPKTYLMVLEYVLTREIEKLGEVCDSDSVSDLAITQLALVVSARTRLVLALDEYFSLDGGEKLCAYAVRVLESKFMHMCDEGYTVDVSVSMRTSLYVTHMVSVAVGKYAELMVFTVSQLKQRLPSTHLACVSVGRAGSCVVVGGKHQLLTVGSGDCDLPVITKESYGPLLKASSTVDVCGDVQEFLYAAAMPWTYPNMWNKDLWSRWLWLVAVPVNHDDYCYQALFPPAERLNQCQVFGKRTYGMNLVNALSKFAGWAVGTADVTVSREVAHVSSPGGLSAMGLDSILLKQVGGDPSSVMNDDTDYYTIGLIDSFFNRRKVVSQPVPTDEHEIRFKPPEVAVGGDLATVARQLYGGVGQSLSPTLAVARMFDEEALTGSRKEYSRVSELMQRLSVGAAISEKYYSAVKRRAMIGQPRPLLNEENRGSVFHIYHGAPADDGGSGSCWKEDTNSSIDGWTSFVAKFDTSKTQVWCFTAPVPCSDVRMDLTGGGSVHFGLGYMYASDNVVWFSDSVKIAVKGKVTARVWVPDAGHALVMQQNIRRYGHIPGSAVHTHCFVYQSVKASVYVDMSRNPMVHAGCATFAGQKTLNQGRYSVVFRGIVNTQPFRLLIRAAVTDVLTAVVNGFHIPLEKRQHVGIVFDPGTSLLLLDVRAPSEVLFSAVQISDNEAYMAAHGAHMAKLQGRERVQSMSNRGVQF